MHDTSRPLLRHQQRALAAAAGLVGRPRLRTGLALTLAFACAPFPDDGETGGAGPTSTTDAGTTRDTTGTPTTGEPALTTGEAGSASDSASSDTLLTDAGTTFATTGPEPGGTGTTSGTDTGGSTGADTGTTDGLDDCWIDRTKMEVDWACCEAQMWLPTPQCTPWGPPAPPVAGGRLALARLARRGLA